METIGMSEDNAKILEDLLKVFHHARAVFIEEGSLRMATVTLEWKKDIVRISVKEDFFETLEREALDHETDNR